MTQRRSRRAPALAAPIEGLEVRSLLSTATAALPVGAAEVASAGAKTTTSLTIHGGTLGQPVYFTVQVKGSGSSGAPTGTINLMNNGTVMETLTLAAKTSAGGKATISGANATMVAQPGGEAYYFGKHAVTAVYVPSGSFAASSATKSFTVTTPAYHTLSSGVKVATVTPGSGPYIQSGQTANVLYTGYLAKSGKLFDDSVNDGGAPLAFTLGGGQVIPGFDAGTVGMQAGETRIISIPPAEGYGATANGAIPANSNLIFVVTLKSIS